MIKIQSIFIIQVNMKIGSQQLILFFQHQINILRKNPREIIPKLQSRLRKFTDQYTYQRQDIPNIFYKTQQGKSAVHQAINALQNHHHGFSPFHLSVQLCQVAYKVSLTLEKTAQISNFQQFKKKLKEELNHLKCEINQLQVLIEYGFRKDQEIIPTILVDDGNPERIRRKALLNEKYKYIGISVQEHTEYDYYILILLTDKLISHNLEPNHKCQCQLI